MLVKQILSLQCSILSLKVMFLQTNRGTDPVHQQE